MGHGVGALAWAVALAPLPALLAATALDRGPDGNARWALFPAVLTAFDPFVWEAARNSLILATLVTFAARILGVGLARVAMRWRYVGRDLLVLLTGVVVVVPPAFAALGLRHWLEPLQTWPQSTRWPWLPSVATHLAWFWVELLVAAPVIFWTVSASLRRVDPVWEDAAKLAGASRQEAWRHVIWPVVRPDTARALALVFTWTLLEPGAPLVLGLRRTLAYQTVFSALSREVGAMSRAAALAVGAVALATIVHVLLGWWGHSTTWETPARWPVPRPRRASWTRALAFVGLWFVVLVLAWLPIAGLAVVTFRPGNEPKVLASFLRDPLIQGYLTHALIVALAAVGVDLWLCRILTAWARRGGGWVDRLASWPEAVPPLAIGVGVLALPEGLRMIADTFPASHWRPSPAELLKSLADFVDVDRTPWVALIFAVALVRLPQLARAALARRWALQPRWIDAAVSLGASPRAARRVAYGRSLGVPWESVLLLVALASTNVTPALLFTPTADVRTVGPAVLNLLDEPRGLTAASMLALLGIVVNLMALMVLALAARAERAGVAGGRAPGDAPAVAP